MGTGSSLEGRVRKRLAGLAEAGLRRTLSPPAGFDFSSNDYLGLARHPRIIGCWQQAAAAEGCGSTGSRLLRGDRLAFHDVEQRFATFKGTKRSLYFSSGYLANLAVMTTLTEPGDLVLSDASNHASLIDGIRLSTARRQVFRHNDVEEVVRLLHENEGAGERFVVVESLFSMDGDVAPLAAYVEACRAAGATLVVDEAHAVGVYGERGSGLVEACGLAPDVCLSINTAGKALGVCGAFVAGPSWAIEYLVQRARPFVFSTAPPPAMAAALTASLDVLAEEPERRQQLRARVRTLRRALRAAGVDVPLEGSQIVPIVIGENRRAVAVAAALQAEGFDVRAIRPPTVPPGTARLRVAVNGGLGDDTIASFAAALAVALKGVELCSEVSS